MYNELSLEEMKREWHGTLKTYIIGFIVSIVLTSASFILAITRWISGDALAYTLVGLALCQAIFQLIFFLHLGEEAKPRWKFLIFFFMFLVLLIIAIGSLWIIYDLNQRLMTPM